MSKIYFSRTVGVRFLIIMLLLFPVIAISISWLEMNFVESSWFVMTHISLSYFITASIFKRSVVTKYNKEEVTIIINPAAIVFKLFLGMGLILYLIGWILQIIERTTMVGEVSIWIFVFILLQLGLHIDPKVIITKTHIYYRNLVIDKEQIDSVKVKNYNNVLVILKNKKKIRIQQYAISKHELELLE